MTDRALVVLSGGQDSTTCLFWAMDRFGRVAEAAEVGCLAHVDVGRPQRDACRQ